MTDLDPPAMTEAEYNELIFGELGLCGCSRDIEENLDIVRGLLEVADGHEEDDGFDQWLHTQAILPDFVPGRLLILGSLTVSGLIIHEEGNVYNFRLTERGESMLEFMRAEDEDEGISVDVVLGDGGSGSSEMN